LERDGNNWISGIWSMIPLAILWCTWKERNSRIFEGKALSYQNFKLYFLRLLCSWSLVLKGKNKLQFFGFCRLDYACELESIMFLKLLLFYVGCIPLGVFLMHILISRQKKEKKMTW